MENFKIDLFEKETGELFPSFQKLNQTAVIYATNIFERILKYMIYMSLFLIIFNQMVLL